MLSVASRICQVLVGCGIGIVNPHIKTCHLIPPAPHSVGWQVKLTPSCELVEAPDSGSEVTGCINWAECTHHCTPLWGQGCHCAWLRGTLPLHMKVHVPLWSRCHSHILMAVWMVTSHITRPMDHRKHATYVSKRTFSHVVTSFSFPLSTTRCSWSGRWLHRDYPLP